jgi:hypothetical protein
MRPACRSSRCTATATGGTPGSCCGGGCPHRSTQSAHPARARRRRPRRRRLPARGPRRRRRRPHGRPRARRGRDRRAPRQPQRPALRPRPPRADARNRTGRRLPRLPRQPRRARARRCGLRAHRPADADSCAGSTEAPSPRRSRTASSRRSSPRAANCRRASGRPTSKRSAYGTAAEGADELGALPFDLREPCQLTCTRQPRRSPRRILGTCSTSQARTNAGRSQVRAPAPVSNTDAVSDAAAPVCTGQTTPAFVKQRARVLRCRHARLGRAASVRSDRRVTLAFAPRSDSEARDDREAWNSSLASVIKSKRPALARGTPRKRWASRAYRRSGREPGVVLGSCDEFPRRRGSHPVTR